MSDNEIVIRLTLDRERDLYTCPGGYGKSVYRGGYRFRFPAGAVYERQRDPECGDVMVEFDDGLWGVYGPSENDGDGVIVRGHAWPWDKEDVTIKR